jgi:peptidoglycan/xylan/chitin deacetylase (PgdA/CDA1 family)
MADPLPGLETEGAAETIVKAATLLYHDAVLPDGLEDSGFPGQGAGVYKLDVEDLERHFEQVRRVAHDRVSTIHEALENPSRHSTPVFLTFDDGGVSAATYTADLLERLGWRGHFFVTGSLIDTSGFLSVPQIRDLHSRGHIIGSHSWTHPSRMSSCSWDQLVDEWTRSVARLTEILGANVETASVPGGYYSRKVARAAAACGIRVLFTSEPTKRIGEVAGCKVVGRYSLLRGMNPEVSGSLSTAGPAIPQLRQYVMWNMKKTVKRVGGTRYLKLRDLILGRRTL